MNVQQPNQREITLAQALTYKKRLASAISKTTSNIMQWNSTPVHVRTNKDGEEVGVDEPNREVDVRALIEYRSLLKSEMMNLKIKLWKASEPIRKSILSLAEMKDDVAFYQQLNTRHGRVAGSYIDRLSMYDAVLRQSEVDQIVIELTRQIDTVQATIDEFNHVNRVTINDIGLI